MKLFTQSSSLVLALIVMTQNTFAFVSYPSGNDRLNKNSTLAKRKPINPVGFYGNSQFPIKPDPILTPGELCPKADSYRYPEHIAYCERNVDYQSKINVIEAYDKNRGYSIEKMDRRLFKIDHYIPLCMGGGNDKENLWPQHISISEKTDKLEENLCKKMAAGRLHQVDAIALIKKYKANPDSAPRFLKEIEAL